MRKGTFTSCVVVIIKKGYDQNFQFHLSETVLIHTRVWPDKSFFLQLLAHQIILFLLILDHQKNGISFEKSNSCAEFFNVSPPCTTFSLNSMKSN